MKQLEVAVSPTASFPKHKIDFFRRYSVVRDHSTLITRADMNYFHSFWSSPVYRRKVMDQSSLHASYTDGL